MPAGGVLLADRAAPTGACPSAGLRRHPGGGPSVVQGSGPGGLGAGPHGGAPDTLGRRTLVYTGGRASAWLAASAPSDQPAVLAAAAVSSDRRCGSGAGGAGVSGAGGAGASSTGGAGTSGAGCPEAGGADGAAITAPMNMTSSSVINTRKKKRAELRSVWVIGRLRCPAVASQMASSAGPGPGGQPGPGLLRGVNRRYPGCTGGTGAFTKSGLVRPRPVPTYLAGARTSNPPVHV